MRSGQGAADRSTKNIVRPVKLVFDNHAGRICRAKVVPRGVRQGQVAALQGLARVGWSAAPGHMPWKFPSPMTTRRPSAGHARHGDRFCRRGRPSDSMLVWISSYTAYL